MKKLSEKKKQIGSLLFFGVLFGLTFYFLFKDQELTSLAELIRQVDWRYLGIGLAIMCLFFSCEAVNLRILMKSFGYRMSFLRSMKYSLIDFYFSAVTPGACGGQPAQICYMKKDRIEFGSSSLALLLFNLTYHIGVLLIWAGAFAYTWFAQGKILFSDMGILKYLMIYGVAAQAFLVIAFFTAVFSKKLLPRVIHSVVGLLHRAHVVKNQEALLEKVDAQIGEYQRGAAYIKENPLVLCKVLLVTMLHLATLFSVPFWVFKAFGLTGFGLFEIIGLQAALTLSVESLPLPGGMGAAENGYLLIYAGIFGPGLVLPAMLLSRGLNYYAPLVVGGMVSAFAQLSGKRRELRDKAGKALEERRGKALPSAAASGRTVA